MWWNNGKVWENLYRVNDLSFFLWERAAGMLAKWILSPCSQTVGMIKPLTNGWQVSIMNIWTGISNGLLLIIKINTNNTTVLPEMWRESADNQMLIIRLMVRFVKPYSEFLALVILQRKCFKISETLRNLWKKLYSLTYFNIILDAGKSCLNGPHIGLMRLSNFDISSDISATTSIV